MSEIKIEHKNLKSNVLRYLFILLATIVFFGSLFYFLGESGNGLIKNGKPETYPESLIYSFSKLVSADTNGVSVTGYSEIFSVLESLVGLIYFGYVISKFVSREQEIILKNLYKRERVGILQKSIDNIRDYSIELSHAISFYKKNDKVNISIIAILVDCRRIVRDLGGALNDGSLTTISNKKHYSIVLNLASLVKKVLSFVKISKKTGENTRSFKKCVIEFVNSIEELLSEKFINSCPKESMPSILKMKENLEKIKIRIEKMDQNKDKKTI